jgi:hypothetical protein
MSILRGSYFGNFFIISQRNILEDCFMGDNYGNIFECRVKNNCMKEKHFQEKKYHKEKRIKRNNILVEEN